MLKYTDYDIVFQEIPDEVTLAINLSNCPHRCPGCHSPQLQQNIGKELNEEVLSDLLRRYESSITCVCFMGGDAAPDKLCRLAEFVKENWSGKIKTAWYSGCNTINNCALLHPFNFVKLGAYVEAFGGLDKETTNQRLYKIENGFMNNITAQMQNSTNNNLYISATDALQPTILIAQKI